MKLCANLLALIVLVTLTCGFTWPFAGKDTCTAARTRLQALAAEGDDRQREKTEEELLRLCPEGATGYYVRARRNLRRNEKEEAGRNLRKAIELDDTIPEAHGELGLLLVGKETDQEAAVELEKGLRGHSDPAYHRALAEILSREKVYFLALYHYMEALKAYPGQVKLLRGVADSHVSLGHLPEAERWYRKLIETDRGDQKARLGLVAVLRNMNRLDEAVAEVNRLIGTEPGNKELHRLLGEIYQERGDREHARREYALAGIDAVIDPADYVRKGDELFASRSYDKAANAFRAALAANPELPGVLLRLGNAEMSAGHDEAALEAYRKAVAGGEATREARQNLGILYERKGMLDEAVAEYRKVVESSSSNSAVRNRLGDIYFARGDFLPAIEQYREILRSRSDNPVIHLKLAKAFEKSKEYKGAMAEYLAALKLDGNNLEAHRDLAMLYGRRGMHDKAESELKEILRLNRADQESRLALTTLYVKKRRYDDLLQVLKDGVEVSPKDPNAHYKLGLVLEFKKDFTRATDEYERTVELQPDHAKGLNALGRMYLKHGRAEDARKVLEAAKKADPTFAEPVRLLASVREDLSPEISAKKPPKGKKHIKKSKKKPNKSKIRKK